jgi:hypothetical protein
MCWALVRTHTGEVFLGQIKQLPSAREGLALILEMNGERLSLHAESVQSMHALRAMVPESEILTSTPRPSIN